MKYFVYSCFQIDERSHYEWVRYGSFKTKKEAKSFIEKKKAATSFSEYMLCEKGQEPIGYSITKEKFPQLVKKIKIK